MTPTHACNEVEKFIETISAAIFPDKSPSPTKLDLSKP